MPHTAPSLNYRRPEGLPGVELLLCPETSFDFSAHFHDAWCFWFNTAGGEWFSMRGTSDILQADSIGVVEPGEVHANRPHGSRRVLRTFYIQDSAVQAVAEQLGGKPLRFQPSAPVFRDAQSRQRLSALHALLFRKLPLLAAQEVFIDTFSMLLARHGTRQTDMPRAFREATRARRVQEYLKDNLARNVSLDELAGLCNCTPRHVLRFFRNEIGMTPHAWFTRTRLEHAKSLLGQGGSPAETALSCGFSDQSHLTRLFRSRYGITPANYRKLAD